MIRFVLLFTSCSFLLSTPVEGNTYLENQISNMEAEINYLRHAVENQDAKIESLQKEIVLLKEMCKASCKSNTQSSGDALKKDLSLLKEHSNTTVDAVHKQQMAYQELESKFHQLERAVKALAVVTEKKYTESDTLYTVKKGDTLGKIAKDHKVHLAELKEYNSLNSNTIVPGQELKIPS